MVASRRTATCGAVWTLAALTAYSYAGAQGEQKQATVTLGRWQSRELQREDLRGKRQRSRDATFGLGGETVYGIKYVAAFDEANPDRAIPVEGYIGMPRPSSENWYHSGFLFISINGQDIGTAALSSMMVTETGERAILDMVWHHPLASVRARFLGLPGGDCLYVEIAIEPRQEITELSIRARCYPSFFTAWHQREGARRIETPTTVVLQGERETVSAADNWWMVYYDEVFDVASGEGVGPCGMMVLPQEGAEVTLAPGSYAVDTRLDYPPTARRLRLAFWDFKGQTNEDVLRAMPTRAAAARRRLTKLDFTPEAIRSFDFASARAEMQRAGASEAVRVQLGHRLAEMQTWLAQAEAGLAERAEAPEVSAAEAMLQSIDQFHAFVWEVRLAELLDF